MPPPLTIREKCPHCEDYPVAKTDWLCRFCREELDDMNEQEEAI